MTFCAYMLTTDGPVFATSGANDRLGRGADGASSASAKQTHAAAPAIDAATMAAATVRKFMWRALPRRPPSLQRKVDRREDRGDHDPEQRHGEIRRSLKMAPNSAIERETPISALAVDLLPQFSPP